MSFWSFTLHHVREKCFQNLVSVFQGCQTVAQIADHNTLAQNCFTHFFFYFNFSFKMFFFSILVLIRRSKMLRTLKATKFFFRKCQMEEKKFENETLSRLCRLFSTYVIKRNPIFFLSPVAVVIVATKIYFKLQKDLKASSFNNFYSERQMMFT